MTMEGNGNYSYTLYVPSSTLLPLTYFFYASDYAMNINTTGPRTVKVKDNDAPRFIRDLSGKYGTTGEPITFTVDVDDNIAVSSVQVGVRGTDEHQFVNITGKDRYSVTVTVPEDTITLSYIFHTVDEAGNWNHSGKKSFSIKDNDGPYFGPDLTPNIGFTGNTFTLHCRCKG
ncbi:MAG: hypothetical protein M0C28_43635 [Candidatus Moduliflexus flocculans]|nr:hypothetical protein [Candidatus Moduliflexus flocculans]